MADRSEACRKDASRPASARPSPAAHIPAGRQERPPSLTRRVTQFSAIEQTPPGSPLLMGDENFPSDANLSRLKRVLLCVWFRFNVTSPPRRGFPPESPGRCSRRVKLVSLHAGGSRLVSLSRRSRPLTVTVSVSFQESHGSVGISSPRLSSRPVLPAHQVCTTRQKARGSPIPFGATSVHPASHGR